MKGQFPKVIQLADLNGQNGFKLYGQYINDWTGYSVNTAGDVNGDGDDDLIIGAREYPQGNGTGCSYVVFGMKNLGGEGLYNLSSLSWPYGFKILGENPKDRSGTAVCSLGDFNKDGYDDLLIGAVDYPSLKSVGRAYVVFGGENFGLQEGILNLSNLNGSNGFKLDGENAGDYCGVAVSPAGDINADGYLDLIIGCFLYPPNNQRGASYVLFGGSDVGNSGLIQLSNLNGINGFRLDGENAKDGSGISVRGLGDINGDGADDLIIGAPAYPSGVNKGRSYVVFGAVNVGGKGIMSLSSLNGTNGFKLDGENNNDNCGHSVNTAGDVNGDGYTDLVIGAWSYPQNNQTGATYVVFGGLKIGNSGLIGLSKLSGTDGFKFKGENSLDTNGFTVGSVGDFNGDGIDDLYSNAPGYSKGGNSICGYIIFGTANLEASGIFNITNLTGINGFKILSESNDDLCGWGISRAGDVNGDGVVDLVIGAHQYRNYTGRSYVIFGDIPPVLVNNHLNVTQGETIVVNSDILLAVDENHNSSQLLLIIEEIQHGQFAFIDAPDQPVTIFSQEIVLQNQIIFQHDNSSFAPSYSVSVNSTGFAFISSQSATIDFDAIPLLINNNLKIAQGQTVILSTENLNATQPYGNDSTLLFTISDVDHGYFNVSSSQSFTGQPITFKQQDVIDRAVKFTHDNSVNPPGYTVMISDGRVTSAPNRSSIFFDVKPVLVNNQLLMGRGGKKTLTIQELSATHNGVVSEDLIFIIQANQHGQFERFLNPGQSIFNFSQGELLSGNIVFVHDNSSTAPSYEVKADDGFADSGFFASTTLLITRNNFLINQGQRYPVTVEALNITSDTLLPTINWIVDSIYLQQGQFEQKNKPSQAIYSFIQQQVVNQEIVFVPDGTATAPAFTFQVNGDGHVYGAVNGSVDFATPPQLQQPFLKIAPPDRVLLTKLNLQATDDYVSPSELLFSVSEVKNNHFAFSPNWDTPIFNFTQQNVLNGNIYFIADTDQTPSFMTSVFNGRMNCTGCPRPAQVSAPNYGGNDDYLKIIKNSLIGAVASGIVGLLFFALKYKHSLSLQRSARPMIDGEEQETYSDALLLPIAREIFSRIKITGCLGYIGKRQYNEYIGAVSVIVAALETKGVIQPDNWNSLSRPQKQKIIDAIAMHTQELVGNDRCCSARTFTSFYKAEATPKMIRNKAEAIADAVQETLSDSAEAKGSRSRSNVRQTQTSSSLNDSSQLRTSLLGTT